MKKSFLLNFIFVSLISIMSSFSIAEYVPTDKSANQTNDNSFVNYSFRSLINSSSAVNMSVSESDGNAFITTTPSTPLGTDDYYVYIYKTIAVETDCSYTIPGTGDKYWVIPFDGRAPIQIANIGGGGSGTGSDVCQKQFCPCESNKTCHNECLPDQASYVNGTRIIKCKKVMGGQGEPCPSPDRCWPLMCKVTCTGGTIIESVFEGPCYLIKANSVTINGTTYN